LRAAAFLTKLADRVLDPGIPRCCGGTPSPPTSPWRSFDRALDQILERARIAA
jgi:hypothetical protein